MYGSVASYCQRVQQFFLDIQRGLLSSFTGNQQTNASAQEVSIRGWTMGEQYNV
jgi:hypothetical protein